MGILDELKRAEELARHIDDLPLYDLIVKIESQAVDLEAQNVALKRQNAELNSRLASLERTREINQSFVVDRDVGWLSTPDGKRDGPFCPSCRDTLDRPLRLVPLPNPAFVRCPSCDMRGRLYPERDRWP